MIIMSLLVVQQRCVCVDICKDRVQVEACQEFAFLKQRLLKQFSDPDQLGYNLGDRPIRQCSRFVVQRI